LTKEAIKVGDLVGHAGHDWFYTGAVAVVVDVDFIKYPEWTLKPPLKHIRVYWISVPINPALVGVKAVILKSQLQKIFSSEARS
jgi:hypothetical protein